MRSALRPAATSRPCCSAGTTLVPVRSAQRASLGSCVVRLDHFVFPSRSPGRERSHGRAPAKDGDGGRGLCGLKREPPSVTAAPSPSSDTAALTQHGIPAVQVSDPVVLGELDYGATIQVARECTCPAVRGCFSLSRGGSDCVYLRVPHRTVDLVRQIDPSQGSFSKEKGSPEPTGRAAFRTVWDLRIPWL